MQTHDPLDIAGMTATEAARRDAAVLASEQERSDMQWLMGDERGRRLVLGQLEKAGVFRGSFADSALLTAFNEGRRAGGLEMLARINTHTPEKYQLMLQEGKE